MKARPIISARNAIMIDKDIYENRLKMEASSYKGYLFRNMCIKLGYAIGQHLYPDGIDPVLESDGKHYVFTAEAQIVAKDATPRDIILTQFVSQLNQEEQREVLDALHRLSRDQLTE